MLDYKIYYENILTAIDRIENSVKNKKSLDETNIWDATLMRLQVIGENTRDIPPEIKKKHKEINWKGILSLRNIISHRYQKVDKELIWKFIRDRLPLLKDCLKNELI